MSEFYTLEFPLVDGGTIVINREAFIAIQAVSGGSNLFVRFTPDTVEMFHVAITPEEFYAKYLEKRAGE